MEKKTWWFKACPKCGGDLYEDQSWGGTEIKCLQCGRSLSPWERRQLGVRFQKELESQTEEASLDRAA
ncbi:MAG: hypothetical protein Q8O76_11735 [Chloroflexota bacterium]|nr:hypothetical protein [Chloroflexota bacterium]